ncbi:MAG: hypothetical protein HY927_09395 [Elusimicrobia bacterium]|nr:hypothetical protein [Elusimicrobiota bacterium]
MGGKPLIFLLAAMTAAAVSPLAGRASRPQSAPPLFPGWPASFEGAAMKPLELGGREKAFGKSFPGRLARFSRGRGEVVVRWVTDPSRLVHPASDCFRGLGFSIEPKPSVLDADGRRWGRFRASKGADSLLVRELVVDAGGRSWSDVSSWYWPAALGRSQGPWWAVTVAEPANAQ